jgi:omega-6 fatty acid desaturase (delta-12 desaturase)
MEAATAVREQSVQADLAPKQKAWWIEPLEPYAGADLRRSVQCLLTSVVPYVAMWVAMYYSLRVSYLLTLALAFPTAGFLVRTFIVFHDSATARSCRPRG